MRALVVESTPVGLAVTWIIIMALQKMYWALTVRANTILVASYVALLAAILLISAPPSLLVLIPFPLVGCGIGLYQGRALLTAPAMFMRSKSAREFRTALLSTSYGKISIGLLWLSGLMLLGLVFLAPQAVSVSTVVSAALLSVLGRELVSLPAVKRLEELSGA